MMARRAPLGAVLACLGAAAAIVGSFLPWAHVTIFRNSLIGSAITFDPSGWKGDGNAVFALGVGAMVVGIVLLWRDVGRTGTVLRTVLLIAGLAIGAVTFWDTTHVSSRFSYLAHQIAAEKRITHVAPRIHTRVALGIVIAATGGVLLVFAAAIDRLLAEEEVVVEEDD